MLLPRLDDTAQRLLWKIATGISVGLGLAGAERVANTALHAGKFWIFHAISNCVIAGITYAPGTSGGASAGDTVVAGDRIYGVITSLSLTSGTGELYIAGAP